MKNEDKESKTLVRLLVDYPIKQNVGDEFLLPTKCLKSYTKNGIVEEVEQEHKGKTVELKPMNVTMVNTTKGVDSDDS